MSEKVVDRGDMCLHCLQTYRTRNYVKAKSHEYYIANKMHWGENKKRKII